MTAEQSALSDVQHALERAWPTVFTVVGHVGSFIGVISGERDVVETGPGGMTEEREITLSANKAQFESTDITLSYLTQVIVNGRRWTLFDMPDRNEDLAEYRFRCRTNMSSSR